MLFTVDVSQLYQGFVYVGAGLPQHAAFTSPVSLAAEADGHLGSGIRLIKAGKFSPAEQEFRRAIRLCPTLADAHGNMGVVCARQGRLAEAEAAFRIAIRLEPTAAAM